VALLVKVLYLPKLCYFINWNVATVHYRWVQNRCIFESSTFTR